MDWTPPADGTPCWVELTAVDLARGMPQSPFNYLLRRPTNTHILPAVKTFYTTVFGWHFKPQTAEDPKMVGFQFPDKSNSLSGGFRKVDAVHTSGAPRLYLYVGDLEKTMEVCAVYH
jgi:hypothetical protein